MRRREQDGNGSGVNRGEDGRLTRSRRIEDGQDVVGPLLQVGMALRAKLSEAPVPRRSKMIVLQNEARR